MTDWRKDVETVRLGIGNDNWANVCNEAETALDSLQAAYEAMERERDELREAIASALTSLATGPAKDGYAYAVLFTASGKDKP